MAMKTHFRPLTRCMLGVAALVLCLTRDTHAMSPDPQPFVHTQPDGTKVTLRMKGGCTSHWTEDLAGFTVVRDGGRYVYANLDATGALAPTAWVAGAVNPASVGLTPGLLPLPPRGAAAAVAAKPYTPWVRPQKDGKTANIAANGTVKNLVILAMFSDHNVVPAAGKPVEGRPQADYDTLFNSTVWDPVLCPTGSVRSAYLTLSNNIVTINSTVVAWVTLPQTMAYYAGTNNGRAPNPTPPPPANPNGYPNNAQKMVEDALALVDPLVDFGQFDQDNDGYIDAITIIHSGYGAEQGGTPANSIWSHKWQLPGDWTSADNNANGVKVKVRNYHTEAALYGSSGTAITRIGVICHETGHFFGLPDLYDYDKATATTFLSKGIGKWCMMADSWGFTDTPLTNTPDHRQLTPPHFSAWCRVFLGWVTPTLLNSAGTYTAYQAESITPTVFKITQGFPAGEYLLIENREQTGYDTNIPSGGLAIWHIDDNITTDNTVEGFPGQAGWPDNGKHYQVALLQADGNYDLEHNTNGGDAGDMYRSRAVSEIDMNTVPSTDSYKSGIVHPTTNRISGISVPGITMTFQYDFEPYVWYVDAFSASPFETGSYTYPYHTVLGAYNAATPGSLVLVRGATYSEPFPAMSKNARIQTWRANTTLQKP